MSDLKDIVQMVDVATGKMIHIRGQWDEAGPHIEENIIQMVALLFGEFGWEWVPQPLNTSLANVEDAEIFPSAAKGASKEQGLHNGGRYLLCKKL